MRQRWQSKSKSLEDELRKALTPLYRFAFALTGTDADAQDLVQETFLRAVQHSTRFQQMENKKAWLFKVAVNLFRDRLRAGKRMPRHKRMHFDEIGVRDDPWQNLESVECWQEALSLLQRLPDVQRQVMYLRVVEQFSISEIAETLRSTSGSVRTNLSIARKKVWQMYQSEKHNEKQ